MDDVALPSPAAGKRRPTRKAHNRQLNEKKVKELAALGVNAYDIATHQGVSREAVWQFLDRLKVERVSVERYKENRADVFAALQGKALAVQEKAMDHLLRDGVFALLDDKAKVGLINSVNNVFGTAYDKERLESNLSTSNVGLVAKIMAPALSAAFSGPQAVDNAQGQTPSLGVSPSADTSRPVSSENSGQEEAGVRGEASS